MFDVFYFSDVSKPNLFPHERRVDSFQHAQKLSRTRFFWIIHYLADYENWDWLFEPPPWQADQRHAWASQWQPDSGTYLVPRAGYEHTNYHSDRVITRLSSRDGWRIPPNIDAEQFDFSWHPLPSDHYQHHFPTQWQTAGGPVYNSGADSVKLETAQHAVALPTRKCWTIPAGIKDVDQSWHPNPFDPPMTYHFGTQWQRTGGAVYTMAGATEVKYVPAPRGTKTTTDACWTVPDGVDTDTFDWTWHPDAADPAYIYQFGTQHQRTGGPVYTVPGATEIKYVDQIRARVDSNATAIYEIDHLCGSAGQITNTTKTVRYFDNYRDTLIRIAKSIGTEHEFVWICSSICDYTDFDFSWHPEQWQATMLHVFASNDQKFGDTFFMHVPTFAARAEKKALLEWYDVNFVDAAVPRRPIPVILHDGDSQVDAVKNTTWSGPLAVFTNYNYVPGTLVDNISLWREETKTIVPVSDGAGSVVVPRTAVPYIKTQLYDYPYIDKTQRILQDSVLDIVFISNGEINADMYFEHLQWTKNSTRVAANQIHHVSGVNGRVAAYQEAARHSRTSWFFAVFAKLEVTADFDWSWQPDRMQQPKHYIFHAHNPVNGLVYGHQAMIAYNKKLVLENTGEGLDFTLDQPHEVVPIVSGTAMYHESDWMCWRTAFREVLKLKASLPDVESEHRLNRWLTVDTTDGQWSRKGAEDGVEYYDSVGGDFAALKKSYEWEWLASYAFMKRSLTTDQ
jgi:hypothetical protein